ncbi:MAG: universal stress protein [Methylococcaceae bacterium]|nr:universal stress protein [Methylococcaceae bacterium]
MQGYKHILLAADFSEHSIEVAQRAKNLSQQFQAQLSVVHVTENLPISSSMDGQVMPFDIELNEELMQLTKQRLAKLGTELGIAEEHQWLVIGSPKIEIVTLAQAHNVDLIVVGSHGRHGLALLLGSTANGVLHHAQCDVLAVRLTE